VYGKPREGTIILKNREDGKTYAFKRIKITSLEQKDKENTLNEVRLLASIKHPNVLGKSI
jgi:NIMA (never in mitosis gene a)-related kinase 1/4/5